MLSSTGRQSLAEVVAQLERSTATAAPLEVAELADEIAACGDLLRREIKLRRTLASGTRSGDDRAGLLASVLGSQLSAQALGLITALVRLHWSRSHEFLEATERLAVTGLLLSAERAGELAEVEDELFRFGQIVSGDRRLEIAFSDATVTPERRGELVRQLLEGKARPVTIRLTTLALEGIGGRGFSAALTWLVELAARHRAATVAYVTVATAMTETDERRLAEILGARYGRTMALKVSVDPAVRGGVRVRVGADLWDGTVQRRLADARSAMTI